MEGRKRKSIQGKDEETGDRYIVNIQSEKRKSSRIASNILKEYEEPITLDKNPNTNLANNEGECKPLTKSTNKSELGKTGFSNTNVSTSPKRSSNIKSSNTINSISSEIEEAQNNLNLKTNSPIKNSRSKSAKTKTVNDNNIKLNSNKEVSSFNNIIAKKVNTATSDSIIVRNYDFKPSERIVCFDLDDTLICPKSGAAFSKDKDDWTFLFGLSKTKQVLEQYLKDGYGIVIFTNQGGIRKSKVPEKDWLEKIDKLQSTLDVPLLVVAALESDFYRKPAIGMWNYFTDKFNSEVPINKSLSFYVGDAAGREKNLKGKKDHSDSDYKFALNAGINFLLPELFFNHSEKNNFPSKFYKKKLEFEITNYKKNESTDLKELLKIHEGRQEMIILVGPPGSGKSTLCHNYLQNYVRVNNDTLKTAVKCQKLTEDSLREGKSVVIDNTNPTENARRIYIAMATKANIPVRCFVIKILKTLSFHLNNLRSINPDKRMSKAVPSVVIHTWYKNFEEPTLLEGFKEIIEVPFVPGPFESELDEEIFYMHSS